MVSLIKPIKCSKEVRERLKEDLDRYMKEGEGCGKLHMESSFNERIEYLLDYRKFGFLEMKKEIARYKIEQIKENQLVLLNADMQMKLQNANSQIERKDKEISELRNKVNNMEKESRGDGIF
jgi:hypothetical protein